MLFILEMDSWVCGICVKYCLGWKFYRLSNIVIVFVELVVFWNGVEVMNGFVFIIFEKK